MNTTQINQANKSVVWNYWQRLNWAQDAELAEVLRASFHTNVDWNGPHPLNHLSGLDQMTEDFWRPFRRAFPDLKREVQILLGGCVGEMQLVTGTGHFCGTFVNDWLGIPATGERAYVHFGQHYVMRDGKIAEGYLILDLISLMRQAGYGIVPPGRGAEGPLVPGPATNDGILLAEQDPLEARRTSALIEAMLDGLWRYRRERDGDDLRSMQQQHYWAPDMHWYGPTGIGWCFDLQQFEDFHQRPWLRSFGDRLDGNVRRSRRILPVMAEGQYASLGIWDCEFSVHHESFRGIAPVNRLLQIRDFDWYRRAGDRIAQNWVPIDLIDLFLQMGVDVFAMLKSAVEERRATGGWMRPAAPAR